MCGCADHNKLENSPRGIPDGYYQVGIPDHLTCLLINLYAVQEETVRCRCGIINWFKIEKGVHQGCILSPCLFNLHAEDIIQNAELDEAQAGIRNAGRNINNVRCALDTTLMEESKEELKILFMKVKKKSEKGGLKLNIKKTQTMASSPITSWKIGGGKKGNSDRLYFPGFQNHCGH